MTIRQEFETWFASQFWAECYGDVKEHLFAAWKASRDFKPACKTCKGAGTIELERGAVIKACPVCGGVKP